MHKIVCRLGLRPRPHWGSLQRFSRPTAVFRGSTYTGRERERRGGNRTGTREEAEERKEKRRAEKGSSPFALGRKQKSRRLCCVDRVAPRELKEDADVDIRFVDAGVVYDVARRLVVANRRRTCRNVVVEKQRHSRRHLLDVDHVRRVSPRPEPARQTRNWVIGSPGQWVIWVIFHLGVTGSSFCPGVRPEFFGFSKKKPKIKI